jgi:hypothetical protein
MSCGTVSGFETPLVRAYAVDEGVTRERESVNEVATRRKSDTFTHSSTVCVRGQHRQWYRTCAISRRRGAEAERPRAGCIIECTS